MKLPRDHRDYLEDIRHAVLKALELVEGMAYEDLLVDDKTLFAVVRALEILGEATKERRGNKCRLSLRERTHFRGAKGDNPTRISSAVQCGSLTKSVTVRLRSLGAP